jgi:flavodoxin
MKGLVVYDSYFGNTEKIAQAVGRVLQDAGEVEVRKVGEVQPQQLAGVDLLVVGSPTRAFSPTNGTKAYLKQLPAGALNGVKVAAFDTRISVEDTNSGFLKFMVGLFGYAAKPIAAQLKKKGGQPVSSPEGFIVKESEGPLKEGELERAEQWAKDLIGS